MNEICCPYPFVIKEIIFGTNEAISSGNELREDSGIELREDGGIELR